MNEVYKTALSPKKTPQNKPIPGRESSMVKNDAGGYVFAVTPFTQLERFLILGSDQPTYYTSAQKLTKDNAENIRKCLNLDGIRTVDLIVDVSVKGRAPKNIPALYALAVASSPSYSNSKIVQYALGFLSQVARTGEHVMMFTDFVNELRGWGRSLKRAEGEWYINRDEESLAYTLVKYQNRNGWTNRDILRLSHVNPGDTRKSALLAWATRGGLAGLKEAAQSYGIGLAERAKTEESRLEIVDAIVNRRQRFTDAYNLLTGETANRLITGYEAVKKATTKFEIARLIREYRLTWEMIPNQFLNHVEVWEALLEKMPLTALIRNLAKMTSIDLLKPLSNASKEVVKKLTDVEYIKKSRIHPLNALIAQGVYRTGKGLKGNLRWVPVPNIIDAFEETFYAGFGNVIPTGQSIYIGQDVSQSMTNPFGPGTTLSCAEAGAAMALVFARTEKNYAIYGFTCDGPMRGRASGMVDLGITARDTLTTAREKVQKRNWGGTDCSLPMRHAQQAGLDVDAFIVITDNDTWAGEIHATQALKQYRNHRGVQTVKMVVMAMTSTKSTIADPLDPFNMDVVGFDTAAPAVVADFMRGGGGSSVVIDDTEAV